MAGRPLRPAIDRRLGGPLPRQQANQSSAAPSAPGLAVPGFHPQVLCGISQPFGWLSPTNGHVPMYYSPVRHSPPGASSRAAVRLACVRHAASVQSEPGSNSQVQSKNLARILRCACQRSTPRQHPHRSAVPKFLKNLPFPPHHLSSAAEPALFLTPSPLSIPSKPAPSYCLDPAPQAFPPLHSPAFSGSSAREGAL